MYLYSVITQINAQIRVANKVKRESDGLGKYKHKRPYSIKTEAKITTQNQTVLSA